MTVNTTIFYDWGTNPDWDSAPWEQASPNLIELRSHLIDSYGGVNLGIHADRAIRGGTRPSAHASGAGLDWRFWHDDSASIQEKFPNARWIKPADMELRVLPFLIDWSAELHIQAIHMKGRIWRSRRVDAPPASWRPYNTGYGSWLHIETTLPGWGVSLPIAQRLHPAAIPPVVIAQPTPTPPPPPVMPPFSPEWGAWSLWPLNPDKPRIALGSMGDAVRYLQGVIFHKAGGNIHIGGRFDDHTRHRVMDLQQFFGLTVDGAVGRQTWALIDQLSGT